MRRTGEPAHRPPTGTPTDKGPPVQLMRTSRVLTAGAVALTGALALSACGSDNNSGGASGSGGGIKQFTGKQVDFAGSESALKTDEATAAKTACWSDA